jgi:regulator of sirC expression with transglutaminase-like and TPR domain
MRGLARLQLKKKTEAKADLQKYLELAPNGADAKDVREILKAL